MLERFAVPPRWSPLGFSLGLGLGLCLCLGLGACSGGSDPVPGVTDAGSDAAPDIPPGTFQVEWGPLTVAPGTEDVRCVVMRLGNQLPAKIHQIHNELGALSHHYIIYTSPETEEQLEPAPCSSIQNLIDPSNGLPLMITQKAEELLTLPDGVAFVFEAEQMLRLELHYINASDQPVDAHVVSTFTSIAESQFQHAADLLFIGNPDIEIPAGESMTLGPTYIPMYPDFTDAKFFGFTGHQHQWGTNVTVAMAEGELGPDNLVYDLPDFNWDEPETVYHDPPLSFPAGGGFRFTCDWTNQSNSTVGFGEGVNDEMCFFWAYYYPATGIKTCFHTDQTPSPIDVCCPGSPLCSLIDDYVQR
jgi:hypothetical protein